jgi:hypothetical protein
MRWRKGTLQKLADPGSEFTWATHTFAGNEPLEEALTASWSVPIVFWAYRLVAYFPSFTGPIGRGLLEADHFTLGVRVLNFEQGPRRWGWAR